LDFSNSANEQKDEADIIPIESILEYSNILLGKAICSVPDVFCLSIISPGYVIYAYYNYDKISTHSNKN
jgi:hypothetical protein